MSTVVQTFVNRCRISDIFLLTGSEKIGRENWYFSIKKWMMKVESSKFVFNKNTKYSKSVRPCSSISCVHWNRNIGHPPSRQIVYKGTNIIFGYFYVMVNMFHLLSKPQLNHNSTQPTITVSWVKHENDAAYHPTTTTTTPHKLNVFNISAVTDPILMKL